MKQELFQLAKHSALVHFETCAKIEVETKLGKKMEPPKANVFQRRMYEAYETLLAIGIPEIRILGLKIRQCGGTTAACHIMYHHSQRFKTEGLILADIRANSSAILRKMKLYSQYDRFPWGNALRPTKEFMEWDNGSTTDVTSAEATNPGISRTRSAALFSESCKYPRGGAKDDKAIMASVLPSVNRLGIAESTPDGASGWFYEQWHGTKDMPPAMTLDEYLAALKRGESTPGNGWVKVFAGWWEFEENVKTCSAIERTKIEGSLTMRERRGMKSYNWTVEQLAWRRMTLMAECGGNEELFDAYYPEDEVSCFLASGRPCFDMGSLVALERATFNQTPEEGYLDSQEYGGVTFTPDRSGMAPIQIWERAREGCRYLLWCDPATGEDQTESKNPDAYSIGVLRDGYITPEGTAIPPKVVARVRAPCTDESDRIVKHICDLSRMYGECLIVLEINMGLHIMEKLKDSGLPLFKREVIDPADNKTRRLMYGWKLKDRDQRRTVVDCLKIAIRDQHIDLSCPHIVKECKTFIIDKNGKEVARPGCHDDDVMGLAMGLYCVGSATVYRAQVRRRRKPNDWREWKAVGGMR